MTTIDPNVVDSHLTKGLRERAADLGDEDRFQQQVLATIATLPQRRWWAGSGRRTSLVLVGAAILGLVAGSMAVGAFLRQPAPFPLGGLIAVAADARAGGHLEIPLDPMDVEFGPGPRDIFLLGLGVAPRLAFPSPPAGVERACPAYSPDGSRFLHLETGDGDARYIISRVDASGAPASTEAVIRPPTSSSSRPWCAQWSSDGRSIAYEAPDAIGQMELHIQDIGGAEVIVNPTPNTTTSGGFAWSPVDRTIAYADDGLFIVPIDGSPARLLIPSTDEETIAWITWAPDGSTLDVGVEVSELVRQADGFTGSQVGSEIRRIRLDGTIETVLEAAVGQSFATVWSPDGQTIANATDAGILLTDRDGRAKGVLAGVTDPRRGFPRLLGWSRDGRDVLAIVPADDANGSTLALVSHESETVSHLTPSTRAFTYVDRESVSWQPVTAGP